MALIPIFHVAASQFDIDPTATPDIPQGSLVSLGTDGKVILASNTVKAVGLAADSRSSSTSYTAASGSALSRNPGAAGALVTGAWGAGTRQTQNRVSDMWNEVLAAGKMTVYHSGGEFWTDMYESHDDDGDAITYAIGNLLYCSDASTGTDDEPDVGGRFTNENISSGNWVVGQLLQGPLDFPSGVPGTTTDFTQLPEGGNSLSWGLMMRVKLMV